MRVPRSSLVALAALLSGTLASAGALGADTAALDKGANRYRDPGARPPRSRRADPVVDRAARLRPEAPAAEPAPAPARRRAGVPTDPLGAAILARLADPAPLLLRLTSKERDAIRAFYAARRRQAALDRRRRLDTRPPRRSRRAWPLPARTGSTPAPTRCRTCAGSRTTRPVADADLSLSAAAVLYARDARGGRINLAVDLAPDHADARPAAGERGARRSSGAGGQGGRRAPGLQPAPRRAISR